MLKQEFVGKDLRTLLNKNEHFWFFDFHCDAEHSLNEKVK